MARNREKSAEKRGVELGKRYVLKCLECAEPMLCYPSQAKGSTRTKGPRAGRTSRKRFCSKACGRAYLSKRFDRFIANPEIIPLPQNYDEFLDKQCLPCLIADCEWEGHQLSTHMNMVHGVTARQFKKLAGFNNGTGVVSRELHLRLRDLRKGTGNPNILPWEGFPPPAPRAPARPETKQRRSKLLLLQSDEISIRSTALMKKRMDDPVERQRAAERLNRVYQQAISTWVFAPCKRCKVLFPTHVAPYGAKRCPSCKIIRQQEKNATWRRKSDTLTACAACGQHFLGRRRWQSPSEAGKPHYCSAECRRIHLHGHARKQPRKSGRFAKQSSNQDCP
jgi:ssDNA-binding Zn-finger/Zn-ribbon topoisomerase 1